MLVVFELVKDVLRRLGLLTFAVALCCVAASSASAQNNINLRHARHVANRETGRVCRQHETYIIIDAALIRQWVCIKHEAHTCSKVYPSTVPLAECDSDFVLQNYLPGRSNPYRYCDGVVEVRGADYRARVVRRFTCGALAASV